MGLSSVVHEDLETARQQMNGLAEAAGKISQEGKMMKIRGRCNYSSSPPPARSLRAANSLLNSFRCSVNNWIVVVCFLMMMQHTVSSMGVTQKMRYSAGLGRGSFKISRLLDLRQARILEAAKSGLSQDLAVLRAWRQNSSYLNSAWLENTTTSNYPCGWWGVGCGEWQGESRVTVLNFTSVNITGFTATGISNLAALNSLTLSNCTLNGTIPVEIGQCSNLQTLDLSKNVFTGLIPNALFNSCASLMFFNVSSNKLNGSLPTGLGNCKGLRSIDMSSNNIEGALIPELGELPALQTLALSDCLLTGALSDTLFSNCQSLRMLDVSFNNMLTGSIPPKLGDCSNLQHLKLQGNYFNETVPADLGRLKNLESLELGSNILAGILPESLTNCSALKLLDVSNNSLSGGLPAWLSLLTRLQYVALESNQFTGTLPVEITTLPVLRFLDVSNNSLEGNILAEFGNVSTLKFLRLSSNNFNGSIPPELGNISKLQALDLAFNNLTGSIPRSLGNLRDLLWLQLGTNNLSGEIPRELTNCSSLIWVNLAHNRLTGQIPAEFGQLGWDSERVFMENRQDPWVVVGLGACTILTTWAPGKSQQFEDMLNLKASPKCRDWLPFLMNGWFKLTTNLSGYSIVMSYWQLSKNDLTGPIPDLSNITNLGFLILSENHLNGSIPATIGHLPLYNFNASNNKLTGAIPKEMGNLSVLLALDLSINSLSGPLPPELEKLSYLTMFNVSRNIDLNGSIPNGGQFSTFTWSPYVGDVNLCFNNSNVFENILKQLGSDLPNDLPKLCYGANTTTASSSNRKSRSRAQRIKYIALLSTTCALSTLLAAGTVSCLILNCRRRGWDQELDKHHDSVLVADSSGNLTIWMEKSTLQKPVASFGVPSTLGDLSLTYEDLLKATNNFCVENIIGDGGFGIVYKAKLADGRTVAIKKLIQDGAQGEREFLAEMETLGTIQHKNLVSLLGCCSNNEEKLLVYAYLKNGSLDDWLYESDAKAATLDWHCRLHIALGTARGLSFLHHECKQLIIHRDMKSSNILLDENFKAYLTDFGMARILDVNSSHVSTVVAGTPGYVPPEYSQTWRATTKGDVYSFGVVLLELVSGQRPTGPHFTGRCGANLVEMVRILVGGGRQMEVCDPTVLQTAPTQEISELILLGVRCTNASPGLRPSMLEVVCMLEDIISRPLLPTASELCSTDIKIDVYHTDGTKLSVCN